MNIEPYSSKDALDTPMAGLTSRRQMLRTSAAGFGYLALSGLLSEEQAAASEDPLAVRPPHFRARAKRVIYLFMKGGPSGIDTFDPKPLLQRDDGKELPFDKPRVQFAPTGKLLRSPWKFRQYGNSGIQVSQLFPHVARHVDDLCILNSVHGSNPAHGGACLKMHTGSDNFIRPSMGSWVTYGLGTENQNLPGFITICPTLAHGGVRNFSSAFLPAHYSATPMGVASQPSENARVQFTQNDRVSRNQQRASLAASSLFSLWNQAVRQFFHMAINWTTIVRPFPPFGQGG